MTTDTNKQERMLNMARWAGIAGMVWLILVAVGTIGSGFKWVSGGAEGAGQLFAFATNPFMGLIVGTLATALVQSSSTVTSIIVGLVAGGLPVSMAIPMVMGANIGTTITNTLVSLGHAREKEEFKRAFSVATVHDFFNIMAVVLFLPLEMAFGFLEKISAWVVSSIGIGGASLSIKGMNFIKPITKPAIGQFKSVFELLPEPIGAVSMILFGIVLIFASITIMGKILKVVMVGKARDILHSAIGRGPISGIASGTAVTVLVQSSSTTTSLAVPLAGSGVFNTKDLYPFTLGANIGTCITALLAATAISGPAAGVAMQIALVHLIYNTLAVLIIFGNPLTRDVPIKGAEWLANIASEKKAMALGYIVSMFFIVPSALIGVTNYFG